MHVVRCYEDENVIHVEGSSVPRHAPAQASVERAVSRGPVAALGRAFDGPNTSRGVTIIAITMALYLVGSAALALAVNREQGRRH